MMERRRMERLDHWWAEVMPSYPALGKVVKACLSIFIGPIEQSFSIMNDFMDRKSNHLAVRSYSAIQTIKYDLKARNTTTFSDFHQKNIHVYDAVDKSVTFHMQIAYGRYKRRLHAEKEKKRTRELCRWKLQRYHQEILLQK